MRQTAVGFESKKAALEGILTVPEGSSEPYPVLVVCHAHPTLGGNMNNPIISAICTNADKAGMASLRFNFRGVEGSQGDFTNGDAEKDDLKAALEVARHWPGLDKNRIALVGYSFGAAVILRGLRKYKHAASLTLIAPPISAVRESRIRKDKGPSFSWWARTTASWTQLSCNGNWTVSTGRCSLEKYRTPIIVYAATSRRSPTAPCNSQLLFWMTSQPPIS